MPARKKTPATKAVPTRRAAPAKTAAAPKRKQPATKPAAAPSRKPQATEPAAAPVDPKPAAKLGKPPKLRRKPVRDSFTMPEADFALIATLKARALAGQRETKKSELLRAGLHALAALDRTALVQALAQLEPVKVGRPKQA